MHMLHLFTDLHVESTNYLICFSGYHKPALINVNLICI